MADTKTPSTFPPSLDLSDFFFDRLPDCSIPQTTSPSNSNDEIDKIYGELEECMTQRQFRSDLKSFFIDFARYIDSDGTSAILPLEYVNDLKLFLNNPAQYKESNPISHIPPEEFMYDSHMISHLDADQNGIFEDADIAFIHQSVNPTGHAPSITTTDVQSFIEARAPGLYQAAFPGKKITENG